MPIILYYFILFESVNYIISESNVYAYELRWSMSKFL